jgi:hypothetical protein
MKNESERYGSFGGGVVRGGPGESYAGKPRTGVVISPNDRGMGELSVVPGPTTTKPEKVEVYKHRR